MSSWSFDRRLHRQLFSRQSTHRCTGWKSLGSLFWLFPSLRSIRYRRESSSGSTELSWKSPGAPLICGFQSRAKCSGFLPGTVDRDTRGPKMTLFPSRRLCSPCWRAWSCWTCLLPKICELLLIPKWPFFVFQLSLWQRVAFSGLRSGRRTFLSLRNLPRRYWWNFRISILCSVTFSFYQKSPMILLYLQLPSLIRPFLIVVFIPLPFTLRLRISPLFITVSFRLLGLRCPTRFACPFVGGFMPQIFLTYLHCRLLSFRSLLHTPIRSHRAF